MTAIRLRIKPGVPQTLNDGDNPTLSQYINRINAFVSAKIGLDIFDLPDCPFAEWHEQRLRPIRAANKVLARAQNLE